MFFFFKHIARFEKAKLRFSAENNLTFYTRSSHFFLRNFFLHFLVWVSDEACVSRTSSQLKSACMLIFSKLMPFLLQN